jgi:hypothetical protein
VVRKSGKRRGLELEGDTKRSRAKLKQKSGILNTKISLKKISKKIIMMCQIVRAQRIMCQIVRKSTKRKKNSFDFTL